MSNKDFNNFDPLKFPFAPNKPSKSEPLNVKKRVEVPVRKQIPNRNMFNDSNVKFGFSNVATGKPTQETLKRKSFFSSANPIKQTDNSSLFADFTDFKNIKQTGNQKQFDFIKQNQENSKQKINNLKNGFDPVKTAQQTTQQNPQKTTQKDNSQILNRFGISQQEKVLTGVGLTSFDKKSNQYTPSANNPTISNHILSNEQEEILQFVKEGKSLFFTGSAGKFKFNFLGTGKRLFKLIKQFFTKRNNQKIENITQV